MSETASLAPAERAASHRMPVSTPESAAPDLPSDEERTMLRESVRGFLERHWPAATAVSAGADAAAVASIARQLAAQGLASLGTEPGEGGLREMAIVCEELGRAACPAPLLSTLLINQALGTAAHRPAAAAPLLAALHDGSKVAAFSFGAVDPDGSAGSVDATDGKASGTLRFVEAAASADVLAAVVKTAQGHAIAVVPMDDAAVTVTASRAMGADGLFEVRLNSVAVQWLPLADDSVDDLLLVARLCLAARATGAANRSFEMAVDYARERTQFGQPIGRFQAIQHKLADCYIALKGLSLTIANAAAQRDQGARAWRVFALAACAFAQSALRTVSLQTQHTFGAIGYAEEHEAPRHFKRVHLDVLRHGAGRVDRQRLADTFLGDDAQPLPEYDLGPAGNAFRQEVREWLAIHWSGERKAAHDAKPFHDREYDADFARDLGRTGWIAMSWPARFGGQERTPFELLAFVEEMERVEAPRTGAPVQAAMLMVYGSTAQQESLLPGIARGEAIYGMGYSEPNAGSDLASLRTQAVLDGDTWVINGQKIWTTTYWGDYMLLATRTDNDAKPRHAGLSLFIVPMNTPGITIKTSKTMYDGTFANVFYDDVRLPREAMVGELHDGWKVLTGALATERGFIGGGIVIKVAHAFDLLCDYIRGAEVDGAPMRLDPLVRDKIGDLASRIEVGRQMMVYCAAMVTQGETPMHDAAMSKVFSGELMEQFGEVALDILGMRATLSEGSPGAILQGRLEQNLRHALMWVISIGTNEIQRSLIAQRGLGLPR